MQKAKQCISGHWLGSLQVLGIKQRLLILQPSLITFCTCICNGWLFLNYFHFLKWGGLYIASYFHPLRDFWMFFKPCMFCYSSGISQGGCRRAWSGAQGKESMSKDCRITPSLPPDTSLDCLECTINTSFCFSTLLSVRQSV